MIYIHIPFCHRKCSYCAFYSKVESGRLKVERYVDALLEEMASRRNEQTMPVRTVYFGGGTPSILSISQLGRIVDGLRTCFDLHGVEEATLECNPEDLTPEYLDELRKLHFFNRLSVGVQSFDERLLRTINRRHSPQQAIASVRNAYDAGFENVTIDLIYGLPGQTMADWQATLAQATALPIKHISAYALTVEEGTILAAQIGQGRVTLPPESLQIEMYGALLEHLALAGFEQYEISNFSLPGYRSRHNSRYWDRTPYLGLGAAAHSFDGQRRRWNVADVERYCALHSFEEEILDEKDAYNELLMLRLRTVEGINRDKVPTAFVQQFDEGMLTMMARGWIVQEGACFLPTREGLLHADGMASELFV